MVMQRQRTDSITRALQQWRDGLRLSRREQALLGPELRSLDRQLQRLEHRQLRLAVFGRVGVGKSSLLNALLGRDQFATDVANGCTRRQATAAWERPWGDQGQLELVDTPGIDDIATAARQRLASRVASGSDLVLMVLDGDISAPELEALNTLRASGKPVLVVANRADVFSPAQRRELAAAINRRSGSDEGLVWVAAAPRQRQMRADGRVRSVAAPPTDRTSAGAA